MICGIINVLKPPGMTSHDVVSFVRRIYSQKKVGHAGTLDPAAAGVLPVFLGSATRLIEYTGEAEKAYRVELTFGMATDTGDDTGTIIAQDPNAIPDAERITDILANFIGAMEQIPPMHSAIKIGGQKLYELARKGIEVARAPKKIVIHDLQLLKIARPSILFDVTCSKGTYIRSLCTDIGAQVGCPAVMSFLVRTRVGTFELNAAHTLEEIAAQAGDVVLPADYAIRHLPQIFLAPPAGQAFRNGVSVKCDVAATGTFRVYAEPGEFIGIGECRSAIAGLRPIKVLSM